jgi:hypothetical protein
MFTLDNKTDNMTHASLTDFFEILLENNPSKILALFFSFIMIIFGVPCLYNIIWFERLTCYNTLVGLASIARDFYCQLCLFVSLFICLSSSLYLCIPISLYLCISESLSLPSIYLSLYNIIWFERLTFYNTLDY